MEKKEGIKGTIILDLVDGETLFVLTNNFPEMELSAIKNENEIKIFESINEAMDFIDGDFKKAEKDEDTELTYEHAIGNILYHLLFVTLDGEKTLSELQEMTIAELENMAGSTIEIGYKLYKKHF